MELQIRIAYETAEMLEQLKAIYQKQNNINFTKGEVLSKAIMATYDQWGETEWDKVLSLPVKIDQSDAVSAGALRPKFQIANDIETKITELKENIRVGVGANFVKNGAAVKFVLRLALYTLQNGRVVSVESVISDTLDHFVEVEESAEMKTTLQKFAAEVVNQLELNDLL